VPAKRTNGDKYQWDSVPLGEWAVWIGDVDGDTVIPAEIEDDAEAMRQATRIRVAAIEWARRRGLRVESERKHYGRVLMLRFVVPAETQLG
jgi:hypothetical protein